MVLINKLYWLSSSFKRARHLFGLTLYVAASMMPSPLGVPEFVEQLFHKFQIKD